MPRKRRKDHVGHGLNEALPGEGAPTGARYPFLEWRRAYVLAPVMLAVLVSINSLKNGFAFDDQYQVVDNVRIRDLANLPLAFTTGVWSFVTNEIGTRDEGYYRPVFSVLFIINYGLFGTRAWAWHLVNILIHSAVAFLVFLVLRRVTRRDWLAAVAAAFFAVHPAHAESVAWVSGVTDPLMALFLLSAFYFYLRYDDEGRKYFVMISAGLYFLALLSKETAVALLVVVLYCEFVHSRDSKPVRNRIIRASSLVLLFAVPTAAYLAMRYQTLGWISGGIARYGLDLALKTAPLATVKYIKLLVVPGSYRLNHFTPVIESVQSAAFVGPFLLLVLIGAGLTLSKSRVLLFASVWFFTWLIPPLAGLRLFHPLYFVQERYLYLPSIGFSLALALGIEWLAARKLLRAPGPAIAAGVSAILIFVWTVAHIEQNRVWSDTITVFENNVAVDPRDPLARTALASEYFRQGRYREAEEEAQTALRLDRHCIDAYLNLSFFAHAAGKTDKAIEYLERAEREVPAGPQRRGYVAKIYSSLGYLYIQRRDPVNAEKYLRQSVDTATVCRSWLDLGDFYFDQGRYDEALDAFQQAAVAASRKYAPVHLKLARAYDRLGHGDLARVEYREYLRLAPFATDRVDVIRRLSQL